MGKNIWGRNSKGMDDITVVLFISAMIEVFSNQAEGQLKVTVKYILLQGARRKKSVKGRPCSFQKKRF